MTKRAPLVLVGLAGLLALGGWWLLRARSGGPGGGAPGGAAAAPAAAGASTQAAAATAGTPSSTQHDKVTFAPTVTQGLVEFARKPWTKVPLAADEHGRTRARMRAIAGAAIDLQRANARKSTRFRRTSYTQDVTSDRPIHLGDRWGPDGRPTARREAGGAPLAEPMRVVYREGDDGTTFALAKMKEQSAPGGGLDSAAASQQAESFFVENGLLAENKHDQIEPFEVRERRISAEAEGGGDDQLLAQQDVLLRRTYEGKQVINSRASVGLLPESGEVVQVQVERWTPVDGEGATTTKPELRDDEAQKTAELLEHKLRRQIELETGATLASAQVDHVEEAWFQTDAGLIPVLVFVVRVTFVQDPNETRNLILAINPAGDDSLIWDQGRIVREPSFEPTDPN
jgi:hypothetical protein